MITLNGTSGITAPTYGGTNTAEYSVPVTAFKNRIINGAMMIDQRNNGASGTAIGGYTVDRWGYVASTSSKLTWQQNAGSVTPPVGFINYLGITSSSAYSVPAGETYVLQQPIEGLNISDLAWGTANASTVTLSFLVRSSLTGTFGGVLLNSAGNRSYPFAYTISSANTWEQKSVTIAGDTTGTWLTTNGVGILLRLSVGTGTSLSGTAGAWTGSNLYSATGAVSVVGTNGATFFLTGVQLEKGSTATSFDYRPYGTELQLCQRYYEKSYDYSVSPGNVNGNGIIVYVNYAVTNANYTCRYQVQKRAASSVNIYDNTTGASGAVTVGITSTPITVTNTGMNGFTLQTNSSVALNAISFHFAISSEL